MTTNDYEYRGLMAQAWDVLRGDTSGWPDRAFYLNLIEQYGQPALDVGCGTGRLLLDYLAQGVDVDGVDNSPEMLDLCRAKAEALGLSPALYEQYVEDLALPRRYRTILVPSSSLQLIIEPETIARAMERLVAHLEPGGALVASFMTLWQPGDPLESEWEKSAVRESDGATFRRVSRSWYDPTTETEATEDLYQVIVDGSVVAEELHRRAPATRSYTQAPARALFERAGLEDVRVYREFAFETAEAGDGLFTVVGRREAAAREAGRPAG